MRNEDEVRRLSTRMNRIVGANPGFRADVDDACQMAWLELLSRQPNLRDANGLAGWLTTVAWRHALRAAENRARVKSVVDSRLDMPASAESPEAETLAGELATALWRAVEKFPERHRRMMLLLAHCPELRHDQLAAELGISPSSVSRIRYRCLAVLRRRLEAEGFSYP
ncbi:sigma-70 family RNA polymerase sigma factor [Amycolatopsis rubida]|uniref:RNA polymerase sigma factor, sigma-70 family n=1 Tax=Amycolatopsis rubida TaxID=112413 RepID=A0A1I5GLP9_9PSEU|nr:MULTISPECIES: sigma-70 family RNA polymerase sigma factor [Amycolatopsis]MYW97618.1 sigma-70 family RNA polymerase sigma factor [Amycolatopsis rubida]NEC62603.1 sigma-70 family RNA polymerase sigma factor [Amycolatopsis rubida]OAP27380.1 RNA polymerase sigma factor FliA [Amycolatopsis sp. M39]SFO36873.1 RNA polymerase sigma factor, sigma-70 family [Amycolatopsis rubida]